MPIGVTDPRGADSAQVPAGAATPSPPAGPMAAPQHPWGMEAMRGNALRFPFTPASFSQALLIGSNFGAGILRRTLKVHDMKLNSWTGHAWILSSLQVAGADQSTAGSLQMLISCIVSHGDIPWMLSLPKHQTCLSNHS